MPEFHVNEVTVGTASSSSTLHFGHGQFFGRYAHRRQVGEAALADLAPTVPEHEVHTHTHDDGHFLLLLGGRYLSSAQGMPADCIAPALVVNPPGTTHRDRFHGDGAGGRFFTLSLTAADWQAACGVAALPSQALRMPASALLPAYRLWQELPQWDDASHLVAEAEIHSLLAEAAFGARLAADTGPAWLARARERLLDDRLHRPSLAELAAHAGVHPVYFARAFRQRYGCSPGEFLRRCRLERALDLLADVNLSLATIASGCGFADQAHFSHAFRRAHGLSPLAYRRLSRSTAGSVRTRSTHRRVLA